LKPPTGKFGVDRDTVAARYRELLSQFDMHRAQSGAAGRPGIALPTQLFGKRPNLPMVSLPVNFVAWEDP
jgi:hypothetical protein